MSDVTYPINTYQYVYVTVPAPKSAKKHISWAHFCLSFAAAGHFLSSSSASLTAASASCVSSNGQGVRKSVLYDTSEIIHPGQSSYLAAWFSSHGSSKWVAWFSRDFSFPVESFSTIKNHQLLLGKLWKSWISIKPTSPTWWRDAYN